MFHGADTQALRQLESQLDSIIGRYSEMLYRDRSFLEALQKIWRGPGAAAFVMDWVSTDRVALYLVRDALSHLRSVVASNLAEQDAASDLTGAVSIGAAAGGFVAGAGSMAARVGKVDRNWLDSVFLSKAHGEASMLRGATRGRIETDQRSGRFVGPGIDLFETHTVYGYEAKGQASTDLGPLGVGASGRVLAGAETQSSGDIALGPSGLDAHLGGRASFGIRADGGVSADLGPIAGEVQGSASVGVEAEGEAHITLDGSGLEASLEGEILVGAKAGIDGSASIADSGEIRAGAEGILGFALAGGGDVSLSKNGIGVRNFKAGAAAGLGFQVNGDLVIDPVGVVDDAGDIARAGRDGAHAVSRSITRRLSKIF